MTIKIRTQNGVRVIKCKPKNKAEIEFIRALASKVISKKQTIIIL